MTHDVSLTYSRFEHMPPSAVALAVLLHVGVGLALFWISPLRPVDRFEDAIEITMDAPEAPPAVAEQKTEPTPQPAVTPAPPPPPPAPVASAPTPTPQPAPPMRLGLPPPAAERSTNPRDVAGAENPSPRATDMPTPDKVQEAGPKEESKPAEAKPQEAKEEPRQEPPEPPPPQQQQQALAQQVPPPQPQQQALAKPEPPPPPPPPSLEQALPPLDAPPPPVTERDVPKPLPVPRLAPPAPPQQQAARPAPPPPAPAPAHRPPPPAPPQQQPRPSPLTAQPQKPAPRGSDSQAAAQPSAVFRNPADDYGQKRAQEQYLWQVMRRIAQFPYVPKNTNTIREEGTVLTRVTIARDGQLLNVVIEKSSGLPSLDAGVMDTIRRASPYPPLPADIRGDRHTFQLPVSFRYNEQR